MRTVVVETVVLFAAFCSRVYVQNFEHVAWPSLCDCAFVSTAFDTAVFCALLWIRCPWGCVLCPVVHIFAVCISRLRRMLRCGSSAPHTWGIGIPTPAIHPFASASYPLFPSCALYGSGRDAEHPQHLRCTTRLSRRACCDVSAGRAMSGCSTPSGVVVYCVHSQGRCFPSVGMLAMLGVGLRAV